MTRQTGGLCYKRLSIGFSKELDEKVQRLNNLPGFRRCTYAECVRILIDAGIAEMTNRYPELKSQKPPDNGGGG